MTNQQFRQLVREMREAQKRYFADRTSTNLHTAKVYEQKVDRAIEADEDAPHQETLL